MRNKFLAIFGTLGVLATVIGLTTTGSASVPYGTQPLNGYRVNGRVLATKIVGNTVYLGGEFTAAIAPNGSTTPRNHIAAFSAVDGSLLAFTADIDQRVRSMELTAGKLFVGGDFNTVSGVARRRLVALDPTSGAVDPWNIYVGSNVHSIKSDGTNLYLGGVFTYVVNAPRLKVAAVNIATRQLVPNFAPQPNGHVFSMALSPDNSKIYLAGNFTAIGAVTRNYVAEISTATGQTTSLATDETDQVLAIDIATDGSKLFAGVGGAGNGADGISTSTGARLWRHHTDGDVQAVRAFGTNAYFGFHDGYQANQTIKILGVDQASGAIDATWNLSVVGFWGLFAIDASPDRLAIGGLFDSVGGLATKNFALIPKSAAQAPLIDLATTWRYSPIPSPSFGNPAAEAFGEDPATWASGTAELGYGDGDEQTTIPFGPNPNAKPVARFSHTMTIAGALVARTLQLRADDGAVVWVNGTEVVRDNVAAGPVNASTRAVTARAGAEESALRSFTIPASAFVSGANHIEVAVFQSSGSSSDLSFAAALS